MFFYKCFPICGIALSLLFVNFVLYAKDIRWSSNLNQGYLDNGFQYAFYTSKNPKDPFNLRLIVNAGSVDDKLRGMAHIVEHMVFRANRAHDIDMHRMFDELGWKTGIQINARTRQTETQYMVRTRPNDALNVQQSVKLLSDLAFGAKLLDREWQAERGVILEEMRRGAGVAERVNIAKKQIVRNGSRYVDRPTIGTKQDIMKVDIDDIRAFYNQYYVPGNMTLVASGYFDTEEMIKAINDSFGVETIKPVPTRDYAKLPLQDGLFIGKVQDPKGSTSAVVYGYRSELKPAISESGGYQRLQNYFLRQLVKPIVRASKAEYESEISSVHIKFSEPTNERLIVAVGAKTKNHSLGLEVVLNETERLMQHGIQASELSLLKEKARKSIMRNRQLIPKRDFTKWEDKLTSAILQESAVEDYAIKSARSLKWIDEITVDSLRLRLKELLTAPDQFVFYQIPGGKTQTLPTVEYVKELANQVAKKQFNALNVSTQVKVKPSVATKENMPELVKPVLLPAKILSKHKDLSSQVVQWQLANGDNVIWLNRKAGDNQLYAKIMSKAGFSSKQYPSWLLQAAQQVWQQSDFGAISNKELLQFQTQKNIKWNWLQRANELDLSAKAASENIEQLMHTYLIMQTKWQFDEKQFDEVRQTLQQSVGKRTDQALARDQLWGTPQDSIPSQKDLDSLTFSEFSKAISVLSQQPVSMYIVGESSEAQIEQFVLPYLASIQRRQSLTVERAVLPAGSHTLIQPIHDEQKSTITIKSESNMIWSPET